ncbi:MAG: HAMP domain-containing protein [Catenulisporales bacterium]|nr:HAMP domain-containing protein [Catenulisporales bacterium]
MDATASASAIAKNRSPFAFWRHLPLRARLALAATVAVAAGVGGGVGFAYVAVRHSLMQQVDESLRAQGKRNQLALLRNGAVRFDRSPLLGEKAAVFQFLYKDGTPQNVVGHTTHSIIFVKEAQKLPINPADVGVATGDTSENLYSAHWGSQHFKVLTLSIGGGHAMQIAVPMADVDSQLSTLGWQLFGAGMAGIVLAAGLGWLVTRTALRPVADLTSAAERIATTHDLAHRIPDARPGEARDELGRLAASFNSMLDAVQEATDRQRQLVADASHELRTPLTSLRTNVEVLANAERLDPEDREALVTGIMSGLDDLTALVTDTVELARGEEQADHFEGLRFDLLVRRCVDRATRHWPEAQFKADLAECEVIGESDRLAKAVRNLLDNAAKFSPAGGLVEVRTTVADGQVALTVRDHGPGIPEADLPHIFDRFYRATSARGLPGSGLGLAIVAQVAAGHGGGASAAAADGGGAEFRLTLPSAQPAARAAGS